MLHITLTPLCPEVRPPWSPSLPRTDWCSLLDVVFPGFFVFRYREQLRLQEVESARECATRIRPRPLPANTKKKLFDKVVVQPDRVRRPRTPPESTYLFPAAAAEAGKAPSPTRSPSRGSGCLSPGRGAGQASPRPNVDVSSYDELEARWRIQKVASAERARRSLERAQAPRNLNMRSERSQTQPAPSFQPRINPGVPDYDAQSFAFERKLAGVRERRANTIPEPFEFLSDQLPTLKHRVALDIEMDHMVMSENRWCVMTCQHTTSRAACIRVYAHIHRSQSTPLRRATKNGDAGTDRFIYVYIFCVDSTLCRSLRVRRAHVPACIQRPFTGPRTKTPAHPLGPHAKAYTTLGRAAAAHQPKTTRATLLREKANREKRTVKQASQVKDAYKVNVRNESATRLQRAVISRAQPGDNAALIKKSRDLAVRQRMVEQRVKELQYVI